MPCEDAPCCGCCGPHGDGSDGFGFDHEAEREAALEEAEMRGDNDEFEDDDDFSDDSDGMSDVEADADTLRSCGWGTDEDDCHDTPMGDDFGGE